MSGLRQTVLVSVALLAGGTGGAALVLANLPDSEPPSRFSQDGREGSSLTSTEGDGDRRDDDRRSDDRPSHTDASESPTLDAKALAAAGPSAEDEPANEDELGRSAAEILAEFEAAYRLFEEARAHAEGDDTEAEEPLAQNGPAAERAEATQPAGEMPVAEPLAEPEQVVALETPSRAEEEWAEEDGSTDDSPASETHVTQVAVVNNIVPIYVNGGTETMERASTPPVNAAGTTMVNYGMPVGDGAAFYLRMNLNAGRAYTPTGGSITQPPHAKSRSAHDRSPWDPVDYTGMHNPWGTYRIP